MRLLVGLGNPEREYAKNRHNVGFMALDHIVQRHNFSASRNKFESELCEGKIGNEKVLALKPQTYMNESGRAIAQAARFYKIEVGDIIVLHDELDLAPGKIKVKKGGGAGGHNGIKSLDSHIGPDYWRIRIGIGHPGDKTRVTGHVLSDFSRQDEKWLLPLFDALADNLSLLLAENSGEFTTRIAEEMRPTINDKTET